MLIGNGTPLHYTLVNNKDWCKNDFEVIRQLRINTENSHQRFDFILLINGLPMVQIELKKQDISQTANLKSFVDTILSRMIFDGEKLTDLLESLELSWKARRVKELALTEDLVPQLKNCRRAGDIRIDSV